MRSLTEAACSTLTFVVAISLIVTTTPAPQAHAQIADVPAETGGGSIISVR